MTESEFLMADWKGLIRAPAGRGNCAAEPYGVLTVIKIVPLVHELSAVTARIRRGSAGTSDKYCELLCLPCIIDFVSRTHSR